MGLQSAMTTSLTGLQAAETTIDVVGNNIANSNTVGFKQSEAIFATQFLQTISIGAAPSGNNGGTNPRQIGLGVKVAAITPDFSQGTIEISSNPLDVAIQGDGFLMVQGGTTRLYTRNGQLKLNSNNEIVTATGQRVLGFGVNDDYEVITDSFVPLTIPLGQERVAAATKNAVLSGVLNPAVDAGAIPSVSQSIVLGDGNILQPQSLPGQEFDIDDILEAATPDITGSSATPSGDPLTDGPGNGVVRYRVVFLDENGFESEASPTITITGDGTQVELSNLPLGTGAWDQGRRIYRTEAGGQAYYRVGDIPNNTDTTFIDNISDAVLAANPQLDTTLVDPGSYSYYVTYYNEITGEETRPTARIGTRGVTSPGGKVRIDLTDLAPPSDTGFNKMRIYRNLSSNSSSFHLIDTMDIGQTSYVDDTPSSALATKPQIDLNGPAAEESTPLVDLIVRNGDSYIENFFEEGVLSFSAEKDGVALAPKQLTITNSTTVQDLMEFMRDAMGIDIEADTPSTPFPLAGNITLIDGKITIQSNLGKENAIEVPLTAFRLTPTGSNAPKTLPISFSETQKANGPGTSTELVVYDSLGLPLKVRITTTLEQKNPNSTIYRWYATSADSEPLQGVSTVVGDGLLEFDSNGDLVSAQQNFISIQRNITASESPLAVELDFSRIKSLGETDAQGNPVSSMNVTSQDGFPPGVMTDFIITDDGTIQGQFSNGTQRVIGQIVMARFANNAGLQQVGDSLFNVGVNSGEPIFGTPGQEGIGTLTSGAVELSNTDVGQNLIELILASTQYRSGARVITAAQELLDELLALRR
jgi:flagellar hook protein FlgE